MKNVIYTLSLDGHAHRYVGRTTKGIRFRLMQHRYMINHADFPLYRWMRKVGPENVVATVLEVCDTRADLPAREAYWVAEMRQQGMALLNCSDGGEGMVAPAPHITAARVAANKRRFEDPAERARIGALLVASRGGTSWNKGVPQPDEVREKIRRSLAGRKPPAKAVERAREALKGNTYALGHRHDEGTLARLSEAAREAWATQDDDTRERRIDGARKGMHNRWHVARGVVKEGCGFCEEADVRP